jgi:hypothetical protein
VAKNLRVKAKRRSVFRSEAKAALTHSKFWTLQLVEELETASRKPPSICNPQSAYKRSYNIYKQHEKTAQEGLRGE